MRGSVVKRGKTYSIVYDVGTRADGRRQQKWVGGFKTRKDAERALASSVSEIENSFVRQQEYCSLGVYLLEWLENYCVPRLAQNTVNGYRVNIEKHIIPTLGNVPLCDLQPEQVQALYATLLSQNLSGTSVLYVHRVLRKALNTAVKSRKLRYNVTDYVDPPAKSKFKPRVLRQDEVLRLLAASKGTDAFIPIMLAATLGLRRGEALGLQWDDIDFYTGTLTIQRTATTYPGGVVYSDVKTQNNNRTLRLSSHIVDYLKEHRANQTVQAELWGAGFNPDNLVTCRADGSPLTTNALQRIYKNVLARAKLPDIRFHDLRYTNATIMLQQQVPSKIVSTMLGHSSIGITLDTYSHVLTEMQQPAVDVMERLLDGTG